MGIKDYQKYIKNTYPTVCKIRWLSSYDNFYIDLNHVLHHVCYLSKDLDDVLNRTKDYLRNIVRITKPKKRVIIAADGPAPLAKLLLQRKRRLDMVKTMKPNEELSPTEKLSLNLTPGTEFMMNLKNSINDFTRYLEITYDLEVIVNISEPDEGEIKIRYILQDLDNKHPHESHAVFSGDSDMILLLFTCHNLDRIYQIFSKSSILSLQELYNRHIERFGKTDTVKYDFTFITLMMGNDYIPKVSFVKLDKIWNAYKKISPFYPNGLINYKTDSDTVDIDPNFFHDLMYFATLDTPKHLMKRFSISEVKKPLYKDYVDGLSWCFGMYIKGKCSDYQYSYDHKVPPHVSGLVLTILTGYSSRQLKENESVNVDLYGILLIPEKAQNLLSEEQREIIKLLIKKQPVIYEEERCKRCRIISRKLSLLNRQYRSYDSESEERKELSKKISLVSAKMAKHKPTHTPLTSELIDKIQESFQECKQIVDDDPKMSAKHTVKEIDNDQVYVPPKRGVNNLKKRLF